MTTSAAGVKLKTFSAPRQADQLLLWKQFLKEEVGVEQYANPIQLDEGWEAHWIVYRDKHNAESLSSTLETKMTTTVMDDRMKALKKLTKDPGYFNGQRYKFATWWDSMQLYLKGYDSQDDFVKIVAVLARLQEGEAAIWAKIKQEEVLASTTHDWATFKAELQERFSDKTRLQKAANDLHQCIHKGGSLIAYLDKFESLKLLSKCPDETAAIYLNRGIAPAIMKQMFSTAEKIPTTYPELLKTLRNLANNLDVAWNYHLSLTKPNQSQLWYPKADTRTGSGTTFGGYGKPMEMIGKTDLKCYNCNRTGHLAKDCRSPKKPGNSSINKSGSKCFNCDKLGHWSRDCLMKQQELKKKSPK